MLLVLTLLASTCKDEEMAGIKVDLNSPFGIGINKKASLRESNIAMEIIAITDNRCPVDVQCFSAGDAKVKVNMSGIEPGITELNFCIGQCGNRYQKADTVSLQHQNQAYQLILTEVNPYPGTGNKKKTAVFSIKKS